MPRERKGASRSTAARERNGAAGRERKGAARPAAARERNGAAGRERKGAARPTSRRVHERAAREPDGASRSPAALTHFDADGKAHMVDVSAKAETARVAVAVGFVATSAAMARRIGDGRIEKGDVLGIARTAGLMALKRTAEIIPLCHPVRVSGADLELEVVVRGSTGVRIRAEVRGTDRTGFEMEALTAVAAAALTIYDMCKSVERGMRITEIALAEKRGGKSGEWKR